MTSPCQDTLLRLRAVEPERDFGQLAAWFSDLEDEPTIPRICR